MALLRTFGVLDDDIILGHGQVFLRFPQAGDFESWAMLRGASRGFLKQWEPTWPHDDLTRAAFRRRLKRYARDVREQTAYPFFVFRAEDECLVGGATISNVRRGVTQSCSLGYWTGQAFTRRGYMTDGVQAILNFVFDDLMLNRIEAACLPENTPSRGLLRKSGFREEGYARKYLKIDGTWRDHVLFAIVRSDHLR